MRFSQYLRALGTALPLLTTPAHGTSLAPWQVARLGTFSPSGRPGSSPDYYIHVNITNPDPTQASSTDPGIASGKVYCEFVWRYPDTPYSNISTCSILDVDAAAAVPWVWTVELIEAEDENPSATTDFDLLWRAATTAETTQGEEDGSGVQTWTGRGHFEVGDNMQGTCAASGFCSWGLKDASSPFPVDVSTVSCRGTVEEALQGINCD